MWRSGLPRIADKSKLLSISSGDLTGSSRNAFEGPNISRLWGNHEGNAGHDATSEAQDGNLCNGFGR